MSKAKFVRNSDVLAAFLLYSIDEVGELIRSLAPGTIIELQVHSIKVIFKGDRWLVNPGDTLMIDRNGVIRYVCRSREEFKKEYSDITAAIKDNESELIEPLQPATTEANHPVKPSYEELIALIDYLTIEYHKTLNREPSARYIPRMYRATFKKLYPKD